MQIARVATPTLRAVAPHGLLADPPAGVWTPVFLETGPTLWCPDMTDGARPAGLAGLLDLRDTLADRLLRSGRLTEPTRLAIALLSPQRWRGLQPDRPPVGHLTVSLNGRRSQWPVHRLAGRYLVCLEPSERPVLYVGESLRALQEALERREVQDGRRRAVA